MYIKVSCTLIFCFLYGCVNAVPISGKFHTDEGLSFELSKESPLLNEYTLAIGDVSEIAENQDSDILSHCLMFGFVDILIPTNLVLEEYYECNGSKVLVDGYYQDFLIGRKVLKNVYRLSIETSESVSFHGKKYKRPKGIEHYYIYYSPNIGILAFDVQEMRYWNQDKGLR